MSNHCTFNNIEELRQAVGQEAFVTDWVLIDQKRIDLFAQATDDPQWIHVDPVRAAKESPFGGTIAHGFLTLSEQAEVLYKTTDFWSKDCERSIRWDDPELAILWPHLGGPQISGPPIPFQPLLAAKDAAAPSLAEALSQGDLFP